MTTISAVVRNAGTSHDVIVATGESSQRLSVSAKAAGRGSSVNGGEFLMLAIATCYCNDLYREASKLGIPLESVEVEATADFPAIGLAATNIRYKASVSSSASPTAIAGLLRATDAVAEVHNTLRSGATVTLQTD
jgi:uncharacterized OsmC-like protein